MCKSVRVSQIKKILQNATIRAVVAVHTAENERPKVLKNLERIGVVQSGCENYVNASIPKDHKIKFQLENDSHSMNSRII